jgi:hypothetical protein
MALTARAGKLSEGMTYRMRDGQSGAGMLSGWVEPIARAGSLGRVLKLEGIRQWSDAVREAQKSKRPYSHFKCF